MSLYVRSRGSINTKRLWDRVMSFIKSKTQYVTHFLPPKPQNNIFNLWKNIVNFCVCKIVFEPFKGRIRIYIRPFKVQKRSYLRPFKVQTWSYLWSFLRCWTWLINSKIQICYNSRIGMNLPSHINIISTLVFVRSREEHQLTLSGSA